MSAAPSAWAPAMGQSKEGPDSTNSIIDVPPCVSHTWFPRTEPGQAEDARSFLSHLFGHCRQAEPLHHTLLGYEGGYLSVPGGLTVTYFLYRSEMDRSTPTTSLAGVPGVGGDS
jgi:hypothetical protein